MEISVFNFLDWYRSLHTYILSKLRFDNTYRLDSVLIAEEGENVKFSLSFSIKGKPESVIFTLDGETLTLIDFYVSGNTLSKTDFFLNADFNSIFFKVFDNCSKLGVVARSIGFAGSNDIDLLRIVKPIRPYSVNLEVLNTNDMSGEVNIKLTIC